MKARILGRNPPRRPGDPVAAIGAAARFLLSDDASYMMGHTFMLDGASYPDPGSWRRRRPSAVEFSDWLLGS
jgi:hypothetical protein